MCDATEYAVGVVQGQRVNKKLNVMQYASKTLDNVQRNYATTEKEIRFCILLYHAAIGFCRDVKKLMRQV